VASAFRRKQRSNSLFEPLAALGERQARQILLVPSRRMSNSDERRGLRLFGALDVARAGQVHASLQALKAGGPAALVERDDLAVEQERLRDRAWASAFAIDGNWFVLSFPLRDQMVTDVERPYGDVDDRADPSYLGS
jgi:hypothetical protein